MNYILFTGSGLIEGKISSDGKHLFVLSDKVRSYNRWHMIKGYEKVNLKRKRIKDLYSSGNGSNKCKRMIHWWKIIG